MGLGAGPGLCRLRVEGRVRSGSPAGFLADSVSALSALCPRLFALMRFHTDAVWRSLLCFLRSLLSIVFPWFSRTGQVSL